MLALLLSACSPWSQVTAREAVWWGPADELAASADLSLVPLASGEPVGRWTRVVVRQDRIDVDNRAWFLTLPPTFFRDDDIAMTGSLLVDDEGVVELQEGHVPASDKKGSFVQPLFDRLLVAAEAQKSVVGQGGPEFDGNLVIVPEPGVPASTIREVMYTAGQAQFGGLNLAGAHHGRLRRATAGAPSSCALSLALEGKADGRVQLRPQQAAGPNPCLAPDELGRWLRDLPATCQDRWDGIGAEVFAQYPGVDAPELEQWQCVTIDLSLNDAAIGPSLEAMSVVHGAYPRLRQRAFTSGLPRSCAAGEVPLQGMCGDEAVRAHLLATMDAIASGESAQGVLQRLIQHGTIGDGTIVVDELFDGEP